MKKIYLLVFLCPLMITLAQVPTGAVGYWPFDNNALDMSGNSNNGTTTDVKPDRDRFGNPNRAYKFDGITSIIVMPNSASTDMGTNDDFTVGVWEKAYVDNFNTYMMGKQTVTNGSNGYSFVAANTNPFLCTASKHIMFCTAPGAGGDACSNDPLIQDSTWHLLTGVFKASLQLNYFYVDGVLQDDSGSAGGTISNNGGLSFGYLNGSFNYFHGVLDDAFLYKRILSSAEILQIYNAADPGPLGIKPETSPVLSAAVSPNPGNDLFELIIPHAKENTILEIYNTLGQITASQKIIHSNTTINLEDYPSGLYYLKLRDDQAQQTFKLIKE